MAGPASSSTENPMSDSFPLSPRTTCKNPDRTLSTGPTLSTGSQRRRLSGPERINDILETGRQRAESYASPNLRPLLKNNSAPNPTTHEDDSDSDGEDAAESRQPERQRSMNYQTLYPETEARLRKPSAPRVATSQHEQAAGTSSAAGASIAPSTRRVEVETRWHKFKRYFQSLELENKGSVARDHLALERTFLAWLRTSLGFASIGIAVTQLFRLNTFLSGSTGTPNAALVSVGKPLGTSFLAISILILFLGYNRYLEGQHWLQEGKFPASRGSIMLVAFLAFGLTVGALVIVIVVQPPANEPD